MRYRPRCAGPGPRRAAASVELAILLPLLVFLFVIAVDFARIFHYSLTVENCARNGALWASNPLAIPQSRYATLQQAVQADASSLNPGIDANSISSTTGTDANGESYVAVTVRYEFHTITRLPAVPDTVTVTRTVQMRMAPRVPTNFP